MAKRVICCDVGDDEGKTWLSDVVYKTGKISMDMGSRREECQPCGTAKCNGGCAE